MKCEIVSKTGSKRLALVFLGWAMDSAYFKTIARAGYDVALVWDYRDSHFDPAIADEYEEICLVAWSLGVFFASRYELPFKDKITKCVAVNGTPMPVSDRYGIPEEIFNGTLDNLDERNLAKFYRRVCGDQKTYAAFCESLPGRDIAELKDELGLARELAGKFEIVRLKWDVAIASRRDMIFPCSNQIATWKLGRVPCTEVDGAHLPDFTKILADVLVDKEQMSRSFARGFGSYESEAAVQRRVCGLMAEMLGRSLDVSEVLEIGSGSGLLTRHLMHRFPNAHFTLWDIAGVCPMGLSAGACYDFESCDAELSIAGLEAESVDIIASASALQWFNAPARFFALASGKLRRDGRMIVSTFLPGNLHEITDLTGRELPLPDRDELLEMVSRHFAVTECEEISHAETFDSPIEVMRHLKLTGVNSLGRGDEATAGARKVISQMQPDENGKYSLTYKPIILALKKRWTT